MTTAQGQLKAAPSGIPQAKEPAFTPAEARRFFHEKKWDALSFLFLEVLGLFDSNNYVQTPPRVKRYIDEFMETFLYLFTQEEYVIPERFVPAFIRHNRVISNLAAISAFKNTDAHLELLRNRKSNFVKILALLSARSSARFDSKTFFEAQPYYASLWYAIYFNMQGGAPTALMHENILRHMRELDDRYQYIDPLLTFYPYTIASYFDTGLDRPQKQKINDLIKPLFKGVTVNNTPDKKSIAIITARWTPTSAVYKSCARFIKALKDDYDLTLVQLYRPQDNFDKSWFKEVKVVAFKDNKLDLSPILNNDFALAYFPDVGMQPDDTHLANLRIAPIQAMGYGHPVSTFGGEIDYFIGGKDVEVVAKAEQNYSERLVLIPGIGADPILPIPADLKFKPRTGLTETRLVINCPWSAQKCMYPHLQRLRDIADQSDTPLLFRFFVGVSIQRHNATIPFRQELESVLGAERVEVVLELAYPEYLQRLSEGAFALDSFPFGGYNTIVDGLFLRKPVVALEGEQFINRAASALLRQVGLPELIAKTPEEFVEKTLRLIHDEKWRKSLSTKIGKIDLTSRLFNTDSPAYFKKAIDYLLKNHARLQADTNRKPVIIK